MSVWKLEKLQSLITDGVGENRTIEYKLIPPSQSEDVKREFLKDVTSFANAFGGTILYGIQADNGVPSELVGLPADQLDAIIQRFDQMLQNSVEPRIQGVEYLPVKLPSGSVILVQEIPQSVSAPHMVTKARPSFFARGAAGKYPMDVFELRSAFAASEGLTQKIERFREERLAKIRRGDLPEPLDDTAVLVFHLIPAVSFGRATEIDVFHLPDEVYELMRPINTKGDGWGPLYSLEGFAKSTHTRDRKVMSYSLLFRNGIVEGVDAYSFAPGGPSNVRMLRPKIYESELRHAIARFGEIYEALNIPGPYFVSLALIGVKGLCFFPDPQFDWSGLRQIASDDVVLAIRSFQAWKGDPDEILKPLFDQIWNACGLPSSRNYDGSGRWNPRP
jgi:hypothetical protein